MQTAGTQLLAALAHWSGLIVPVDYMMVILFILKYIIITQSF